MSGALVGLEKVNSPVMASRIKKALLPYEEDGGDMFAPPWVARVALHSMITSFADDTGAPARVVGRAVQRGLDVEACEAAERLGGVDAVVALAQGFRP